MITLTEYIREDYAADLEEIEIQFKYIISNYFFKTKLIFNFSNISFARGITSDEKAVGTIAVTDLMPFNRIRIRYDPNIDIYSDEFEKALIHELIHVYLARKYPDKYGFNKVDYKHSHDDMFAKICKIIEKTYGEKIPETL